LSKSLFENHDYFSWDALEDREVFQTKTWDRKKPLIVFDELHKKPQFKAWLKGIFDKEGVRPRLLVTGSARLDIAKKMGDSLAGRFYAYRLHPLDLWELGTSGAVEKNYERLLECSGFPEPFFAKKHIYKKWATTHLDLILRQDLLDLESVRSISKIETLLALLQTRVASTVSYSSLARDLEVDGKTVKKWLEILENLFIVFRVSPFHKNIARSIMKEPKYYFYDVARVRGDEGQKLENLVALALKKRLDYLHDHVGFKAQLHFVRTKDGAEIDFYIHPEESAGHLIEVKLSDGARSPHFDRFVRQLRPASSVQIVKNLTREKTFPDGLEVRAALPWLRDMPILNL